MELGLAQTLSAPVSYPLCRHSSASTLLLHCFYSCSSLEPLDQDTYPPSWLRSTDLLILNINRNLWLSFLDYSKQVNCRRRPEPVHGGVPDDFWTHARVRDLGSTYRLGEISPCSFFLISMGVQPRSKFGFVLRRKWSTIIFMHWAGLTSVGALSESDPFYSVYVTYLSTNDEAVS